MGLKEVKDELLDRARKEAAAIVAEGQREADRILKEAEEKAAEHRAKAQEGTARMLETMEKRELAQAEFDVRKAILDKKKDVISKVIEGVKHDLERLPEKRREEYIRRLVEKAGKEIDVATVYANPKDRKAVKAEFRPREMLGGIVAQTADGRVSVDYSYEELLADIEEKSLQELGKILFKQ